MKRLVTGIALILLTLAVAACGSRPMDEAVLPTRVPTLAPDAFAVAAPTATPQPTPAP